MAGVSAKDKCMMSAKREAVAQVETGME